MKKEPSQKKLFDIHQGRQEGQDGMDRAAEHYKTRRDHAVAIAHRLAPHFPHREITIDDVQRVLFQERGQFLGNEGGSLFRSPEWEFTGKWRPSERITNHARYIRVWRLKK